MTNTNGAPKFSIGGGICFGFIGLIATLYIGGEILGNALDASLVIKILAAILINAIVGGAGYALIFRAIIAHAGPQYALRRMDYFLYAAAYVFTFVVIILWAFNQ